MNEYKGDRRGTLSDKIGLGQSLKEAPSGDLNGTLSDEIEMQKAKSIAQLDKEIAGFERLIANMAASAENVDPNELQEYRDNLVQLRRQRNSLVSSAE